MDFYDNKNIINNESKSLGVSTLHKIRDIMTDCTKCGFDHFFYDAKPIDSYWHFEQLMNLAFECLEIGFNKQIECLKGIFDNFIRQSYFKYKFLFSFLNRNKYES